MHNKARSVSKSAESGFVRVNRSMLRALALIEILIASLLVALFVFSMPDICNGRLSGHDCEGWFIFGVNLFAPLGLIGLACAILSLVKKSWIPQYFLIFGCMAIAAYWLAHAL